MEQIKRKQSSIDWLIIFFENGVTSREEWLQAKEQAKAMHKEEQKIAYNAKLNNWYFDFEHYYNETFNNDEQSK